MSKRELIARTESLLKERGFGQEDYIVSLQGPTIIFTTDGLQRLEQDPSLRTELTSMGVETI
jgi:hypothetical protein